MLAARGIDYFFANGGTDFGPIVEAYAKRMASELPVPKPVTVPHEITAVAMAHGYTMVTGRPQVVMVHTIAGTANAVVTTWSLSGTITPAANGSGATKDSAHSFTKTFGQWAIIGLFVDTNSGGSSAHIVITGDGAT